MNVIENKKDYVIGMLMGLVHTLRPVLTDTQIDVYKTTQNIMKEIYYPENKE